MLLCIVCGKTIANVDPSTIRYGGCSSCPIEEVSMGMKELKRMAKEEGTSEVFKVKNGKGLL